jgi:hypothetical protein
MVGTIPERHMHFTGFDRTMQGCEHEWENVLRRAGAGRRGRPRSEGRSFWLRVRKGCSIMPAIRIGRENPVGVETYVASDAWAWRPLYVECEEPAKAS